MSHRLRIAFCAGLVLAAVPAGAQEAASLDSMLRWLERHDADGAD